jgi:hypothetical protein
LTNIEAMRQAADQLEIGLAYPGMRFYHDNIRAALTALRTAIEQAEKQEPVAWAVFEGWNAHDLYLPQEYDEALKMAGYKGDHAEVKPLYTTPPAAILQDAQPLRGAMPWEQLYPQFERATPPAAQTAQRQPLTDDRIGQIIEQCQITLVNYCSGEKQTEFARAIEAAHGIKGEA